MTLLILLACAPQPCEEGSTEHADGSCWREVPPFWAHVEHVLDELPPCTVSAGDGRLDAEAGCADGACPGMTPAEISAALGESPTCTPYVNEHWGEPYLACRWPRGIEGSYPDFDGDGVPDEGASDDDLWVLPPFDGTTPEGLGLDAELSCFVDAWHDPTTLELVHDGEAWRVGELTWYHSRVAVHWDPADGAWDGKPSALLLY